MVFFTVSPFPASDFSPPTRQLWPVLGIVGLLCGMAAALTQATPSNTQSIRPLAAEQAAPRGHFEPATGGN